MLPFRPRYQSAQRGFTLIELLVVISIIGLLASVVLTSLGSAQAGALDARVKMEIRQLQQALELYRADHNGLYPCAVTPPNSARMSQMTSGCRDLTPYADPVPTNPHPWSDGDYYYQPGDGNDRTSYTIIYQLDEIRPDFCYHKVGPGFSSWVSSYTDC